MGIKIIKRQLSVHLVCIEINCIGKPENIIYDECKMLTDKDRKALDWIHKYMEHSSGEDTGQ
jgi:L-serine deaminase